MTELKGKNSMITVNGNEYSPVIKKGYGYIIRKWTSQDTITLDMDNVIYMKAALVLALRKRN